MTEISTKKKSNQKTPHIPSREEFHRYASNLISVGDYCTDYFPYQGRQSQKVESALQWTRKNALGKNQKEGYKNDRT
ncbi:hypothetical protein GKG47_08975 [Lactonifactor sp. BIOML-A3]|uniref:hypothetical protein n=1 Tax=unclassified Lactonifactor TaxID=2636670 RepID=UPI0012AF961C|nr:MULTISPECIES: hypothetical protein [unclassified Lactonifactor]MSA02172.1 hypothetical protein [Lactonifactor sp. BIOML-A5]MSA07957.1 hypothetical protein [Lactonifactor sp. BIOML-A4]MSA12573.1 hypothetical protein [Lactonifactor sp. BIOML-A3]MSA16726.1 hypothetical protein [Lactonifactor sp. BIOML-A2]MSA37575.1 hypothetical protein [Lactonifactor sp. BIOML-A1]